MTDEEYHACTDASRLLHFLSPRLNERKLRLFVAACLRRAAGDRYAAAVRTLVEALEALADGQEGPAALEAARGDLWRARTSNAAQRDPSVASFLSFPLRVTEMMPSDAAAACACYPGAGPRCALLRDIAGNPYRTVGVHVSWLAWSGGLVASMARSIYKEHRFEELPVVADALEEAGCAEAELLRHLRESGEHARGCWALDLLLVTW
jgi:hypothetical protein